MSPLKGKKLTLAALTACAAALSATALAVPAQAASATWTLHVTADGSNSVVRYAGVTASGMSPQCFPLKAGGKRTISMRTSLPASVKVTGYDAPKGGLPACNGFLAFAGQFTGFQQTATNTRTVTLRAGSASVS